MSKNLFQASVAEQCSERLMRMRIESTALWGQLDAAHLLSHLIDAFEVTFQEKNVQIKKGFLNSRFGRWLALQFPIPKGKIKAPAMFHETKPDDFESDRKRVLAYIKRFAADPQQAFGPSPIFGHLSNQQWARLHYLHLDHHLRQFQL